MTYLYVHKTIITCSQCSRDYVFPGSQSCPHCGDPLEICAAEEIEIHAHDPHAGTLAGAPPQGEGLPPGRGHEPDGFAKTMVYIGMGLAAALAACAYWNKVALDPLLEYTGLPSILWPFIRYVIIAVASFGILQGTLSLLTWKSGSHFYRRFRYW